MVSPLCTVLSLSKSHATVQPRTFSAAKVSRLHPPPAAPTRPKPENILFPEKIALKIVCQEISHDRESLQMLTVALEDNPANHCWSKHTDDKSFAFPISKEKVKSRQALTLLCWTVQNCGEAARPPKPHFPLRQYNNYFPASVSTGAKMT